jgi:hypothetical protein
MHLLSQITPIVQPTWCTCYLKLLILVKPSTCFGRSFRPSSGAQDCVYSNGIRSLERLMMDGRTEYFKHAIHSPFFTSKCRLYHDTILVNVLFTFYIQDVLECAVGAVRHPQHTETSSNSSTIAADSSNGVTNTRCCRYSCMRSRWWVEVPPESFRAVSRYK